MKKDIFLFLLIIAFFTGCGFTHINHSFFYHGTDAISANKDFRYIEYNIQGTAQSTFYPNKLFGKDKDVLKGGLIAEAKKELNRKRSLKSNQSYANLSVDILETTQGRPVKGGVSIDAVTMRVIVSADIIEYY